MPDVLISVGAPVIFGRRVLDVPTIAAINVHNGLVPRYRGHFATFWEIYYDEPRSYVCIHKMESKVDSGDVLAWERVEVSQVSSFFELMLEKKRSGGALLARLLREIESKGRLPDAKPPHNVDSTLSSYFPWPSVKDVMRLRWRAG
jgi:methionyl-tRNA formyltransferase